MSTVNVLLLFGGRSAEHEVSIRSARSVYEHLDKKRYRIWPVVISTDGSWYLNEDMDALISKNGKIRRKGSVRVALLPDPTEKCLIALEKTDSLSLGQTVLCPDVIFPMLHGPNGEDGTIQGLFELCEIPYVGCGVLASSTGMDKDAMKRLFRDAGLPMVPSATLYRRDIDNNASLLARKCLKDLGQTLFVKPANMGSSVGVSKATGEEQLVKALHHAATFDRKVIVEVAADIREIELSVLGLAERHEVSVPGEILSSAKFYTYNDKYINNTSTLSIPADLPEETVAELKRLARLAYKTIDGSGLARMDFFVERNTGEIYINELNTMPGFTSISMYAKLWEATGLSFARLLDRLIDLAFERHQSTLKNNKLRK